MFVGRDTHFAPFVLVKTPEAMRTWLAASGAPATSQLVRMRESRQLLVIDLARWFEGAPARDCVVSRLLQPSDG